ncbi:MAG: CsgG/HfaB family protein [Pseudomonadota bacterium]
MKRLSLLLVFLVSPLHADFVAFSVTDSGRMPLPRNLEVVAAESLVNIEWGEYRGAKSRIGVLPVENNSNAGSVRVLGPSGSVNYDFATGGVPVQGIEAILIDVLNNTGRFRLLERTVLNEALAEQDLGASGRISAPSAAKVGKVLGAQYLLQGVITNYEEGVQKSKSSIGGILGGTIGGTAGAILGGIGKSTSKGVVGMNIRLVDAATSEIVFSNQAEVDLSSSGITFGGGIGLSNDALGGFVSKYSKTPIGQAVIAAANKSVFELIKQIGSSSASGSVVKAAPGKIYLNLGAGSVSEGEELNLVKVGEELIDPDTGISLGGESEVIGTIRVHTVKEKFSIAAEETADVASITRGDRVESTRSAPSLEFAEAWDEPKRKKSASGQSHKSGKSN